METLRAQALARRSAADVQPLEAALTEPQRALAELVGVTPNQVQAWLGAAAWPLQQPAVLAAGLPSNLLRRRPDILQAQASLRTASADLAAAAAER